MPLIYRVAWAQVPASWSVANAVAVVGDSFYTVQIAFDGTQPGPFNVCIDELVPLTDSQLTSSATQVWLIVT